MCDRRGRKIRRVGLLSRFSSSNSERVKGGPDDGVGEGTDVEPEGVVEVFDAFEDDPVDPELVADELKPVGVVPMDKDELSAVSVMVEKPDQPLGRYVGSFV